jgi:hypothetical protein
MTQNSERALSSPSVLPPALESRKCELGVTDVLDVLVAQIGLQRARNLPRGQALIGQRLDLVLDRISLPRLCLPPPAALRPPALGSRRFVHRGQTLKVAADGLMADAKLRRNRIHCETLLVEPLSN